METQMLIPHEEGPFRSVLLFGPPGSGKGTLGKFLASVCQHLHLSSGDIFRGLSHDSTAGKLFHSYAHQGHLVPDEVTVQLWHRYVGGLIATNRYFPKRQLLLLDGIPRTMGQTALLDAHLAVAHIIVLEMPNIESLVSRMQKRARIEGRADDIDPAVLQTRMRVYETQTAELLSHYPSALISRFNADQKPAEVLRDVLVSLSQILA